MLNQLSREKEEYVGMKSGIVTKEKGDGCEIGVCGDG
jgi:hypothetical protein